MSTFELTEPRTLGEALALLGDADPSVRPAAGCTALMLMLRTGMLQPTRLVSLRRIEARHAAIEADAAGLTVGAQATLAALDASPLVAAGFPVLRATLRTLANVRVRNVATLGGNLAHADPHMDLPPVLIALGASVTIARAAGERTIALEDLISGYYETTLGADELTVRVGIPAQYARHAAYCKVSTRSADDWPTLGVAVALEVSGGSVGAVGAVRSARVVMSAAVDKPTRLHAVEAVLAGAAVGETLIARAADAAYAESRPIADARGSAADKRHLLRVYVARALRQALGIQPAEAA